MTLRSLSSARPQSTSIQQRLEIAERLARAPRAKPLVSQVAEPTARPALVNASQTSFEPSRPSGLRDAQTLLQGPLSPTAMFFPNKDDSKADKSVDSLPPDPVEDYSEADAARDAEALHDAVDGWGTDEAAVYETLEGKSPAQIELIRQQYQEAYGEDLDTVLRDDFSGDELTRLDEALVGGPYLLERNKQLASQTEAGAAIVAAAEERGVPVHVLSEEEYKERFPDSGGIFVDGEGVYVPDTALNGGSDNVLVHELLHAVLDETLDTDKPQEQRVADARALYEEIGLDPNQGEAIAEATEGWPPEFSVAAEHVATHLATRATERERRGLPPESPEQLQEVTERAATRELALAVQSRDEDPSISDEELLALWASTPQGRAMPPAGDTVEEQAASLRKILEHVSDEAYVNGPASSLPGGGKTGGSGVGSGGPKGPFEDFSKDIRANLRGRIAG